MYQEMNSPKVAEEWMVDELVYREMSGPLGNWADFKTESYEDGKDITIELIKPSVDETVGDLQYCQLDHSVVDFVRRQKRGSSLPTV